jgi:MoaE-MoaD fusion protein
MATVLYFAGVRDQVGRGTEPLELPARATSRAILDLIAARHPHCRELLLQSRVAVDHDFVLGEAAIREGAEVAVIQPVSGG